MKGHPTAKRKWRGSVNSRVLPGISLRVRALDQKREKTSSGALFSESRSGSAMSEHRTDVYDYNVRDEFIFSRRDAEGAENEYAYQYDDIGNRLTSLDLGTNRTYTANVLNQYTSISNSALSASPRETFIPQFDDDGNQTLVKTATGIWQVQYNGENRPVLWENVTANPPTPTLISMSYDRMGCRVIKNVQRFVYDGYLQIANFESSVTNSQLTTYNSQLFIWDPTEPVATRPLVHSGGTSVSYFTHDGSKNVTSVVAKDGNSTAHYEYAPYGVVVVQSGAFAAQNCWRFLCEYSEDDTSTVYYNYRHYDHSNGRWLMNDPAGERGGVNMLVFLNNSPICRHDYIGLSAVGTSITGAVYYSITTKMEWNAKRA